MPSTASKQKRTRPARRPLVSVPAPVSPDAPPVVRRALIATDGSRAASAAIKLARAKAGRNEWAPLVVTVLEPLPVMVGEVVLPAPPAQYEVVVAGSILDNIKKQVRRYGDIAWELRTEFGGPARQIVRAAAELHADIIVVGLGRHGRLARMLGAETSASVARRAPIPVLAVSPRTWSARNIAVAAVDFGNASVRAAREALAFLEPPGRLHLVHVKGDHNMTSFADSEWRRAYATAAEEEFVRFCEKLGRKPGIDVSTALVTGLVVDKILDEAKHVHAQIIALGSHNQSVLERLMLGSTPTELLRSSPCSVLIAPPGHAAP